MGRFDDVTPEELEKKLIRYARLTLKLEEKGMLLEKSSALLKLLGDLRRMLFAYEVRCAEHLDPDEDTMTRREAGRARRGEANTELDESLQESLRVVEEALERERELQDELRDRFFSEDED